MIKKVLIVIGVVLIPSILVFGLILMLGFGNDDFKQAYCEGEGFEKYSHTGRDAHPLVPAESCTTGILQYSVFTEIKCDYEMFQVTNCWRTGHEITAQELKEKR